jgi:hypothetical protein
MVVIPMLISRHILRPSLNAVGGVSDAATKDSLLLPVGGVRSGIAGNHHSDIDD